MQTHHPDGQAGVSIWLRVTKIASLLPLATVLVVLGCGGGSTSGTSAATGQPTPVQPLAASVMWSNAATWGGTKPVQGSTVIIPAGMRVELDEQTVELGELVVE